MKTIVKVITLFIMYNLLLTSNLSAKDFNLQKPKIIPKSFFLLCEKKSIEDPFTDYEAAFDKEGNITCQGVRSYAKPHCPEGYALFKRRCIKSALK